MKRRTNTQPNLGLLVRVHHLLCKVQKEKAAFRSLYFHEMTEKSKLERRLQIELERTAFYCGCADFLQTALIKAPNLNTQVIQDVITEYGKYKREAYIEFIHKSKQLNKIEISINGKYKVLFADNLLSGQEQKMV